MFLLSYTSSFTLLSFHFWGICLHFFPHIFLWEFYITIKNKISCKLSFLLLLFFHFQRAINLNWIFSVLGFFLLLLYFCYEVQCGKFWTFDFNIIKLVTSNTYWNNISQNFTSIDILKKKSVGKDCSHFDFLLHLEEILWMVSFMFMLCITYV